MRKNKRREMYYIVTNRGIDKYKGGVKLRQFDPTWKNLNRFAMVFGSNTELEKLGAYILPVFNEAGYIILFKGFSNV